MRSSFPKWFFPHFAVFALKSSRILRDWPNGLVAQPHWARVVPSSSSSAVGGSRATRSRRVSRATTRSSASRSPTGDGDSASKKTLARRERPTRSPRSLEKVQSRSRQLADRGGPGGVDPHPPAPGAALPTASLRRAARVKVDPARSPWRATAHAASPDAESASRSALISGRGPERARRRARRSTLWTARAPARPIERPAGRPTPGLAGKCRRRHERRRIAGADYGEPARAAGPLVSRAAV
jgi:hypothetical protein